LKKNIEKSFQGNVGSLMQALSSKDICTYSHSKRVGELFERFASRYHFTTHELEMHKTMASLHDIGKIGVRDAVLKKKGRLTAEEYEEIKLHPQMGYHIVKHLGLPEECMDLVLYHQERYDGKGYPHGMSGQRIPLTTRLFSIIDAYDSIRRNRPYRKGAPQQETLDEIKRHAGTQFDPELVHDFQSFVEANAARL
jgi:HD-GYP domain-containing protein (c-di-GMP phosphodiesterase class II)